MGFWDWLEPTEQTRRFIPAAGVAAVGVLVATGQQLDVYSVLAAFVLVPISAAALNLLFRPVVRAALGYQAVVFSLSNRMVKAISKHAKLSRRRQESLRLALAEGYRPLVSEQFDEFWEQRRANPEQDQEFERRDITIVSLFFLGFAYTGCFLISFANLSQTLAAIYYYPSYITALTEGLLVSLGFLLVASAFFFGARSEFRSYRRLLWDRIPLLMASSEPLNSSFWQDRADFFENRRAVLGDQMTNGLLEAARKKREAALRAELERDLVEERVATYAGEDPQTVRILLTAVSSAQRERMAESGPTRQLLLLMLVLGVALVVAAGLFPQGASVIFASLAVILLAFLNILDPLSRYIVSVFRTRAILKRIAPVLAQSPEPSIPDRLGVDIVSRVRGLAQRDTESSERGGRRGNQKGDDGRVH